MDTEPFMNDNVKLMTLREMIDALRRVPTALAVDFIMIHDAIMDPNGPLYEEYKRAFLEGREFKIAVYGYIEKDNCSEVHSTSGDASPSTQ